jgi:hypothetical protein
MNTSENIEQEIKIKINKKLAEVNEMYFSNSTVESLNSDRSKRRRHGICILQEDLYIEKENECDDKENL